MNIIIAILAMVASILLILVVIVQNSKGGGLSNTFGASNLSSMIGNRRAAQDVEKFTWYLIGGLMVISFVASVTISSGPVMESTSFGSLLEGVPAAQAQPAAQPGTGAISPAPANGGQPTPE